MKAFAWTLLLFSLMAAFLDTRVYAEEDVEVADEEGEAAAEDDAYEDDDDAHEVTTSYFIPDYPDGRLPVGKPVTILVDFSNKGQDVFNVTKVAAFLHSPYDLNYFIQNFTAKAVSGVATPTAQISLEYKVTPDEKLEPLEFWLSGYVEYTMEGSDEPYRQHFVNTTVELFDSRTGFDVSSMFTTLLVFAALGVVGYIGVSAGAEKVTGKKKKKTTYAPKAAAAVIDDWDVKAYKQSDKGRPARPARSGKKIASK